MEHTGEILVDECPGLPLNARAAGDGEGVVESVQGEGRGATGVAKETPQVVPAVESVVDDVG